MSFRSRGQARGPGPPASGTWTSAFVGVLGVTLAALLLLQAGTVAGETNKKYDMENLCKDLFRQQQLRKIDGAELHSQNERNLDCVVTFQTHSILQSFMLRFDHLHMDCNDHLYIFDGAHAVGTAKWDLSCRDTKELIGSIHTRTNHVTLKYVTDNWGTDECGFHLIITAVKDPQTTCNDFKCKTREFCIHTDLVCDGVNHCADGSDETASEKCGRGEMGLVLGMSLTYLVVASVSALLILGLAVVGVAVCMYRQVPPPPHAQPVIIGSTTNPFPHSGLNGAGHTAPGLNHAPRTTTLSRGPMGPMGPLGNPPHTLSLMQPGNWSCPVGTPLGYSVAWARLYYSLAK